MISFKQFLNEYLTDEQRNRYANVEMNSQSRKATDPFFGPGNDQIKEPIKGYEGDKSEVHKNIEKHVGREFSVDEYKAGMIRDESGKKVTIPSLIKDKQLKHQFNQDNTRTGKGMGQTHYMTVVRGTEVAGQTNSEPDPQHPKGHSWGDASCKNVDTGINRHFLEKEIRSGTVVVRAHDPNGQEIYRATLQPHLDDHANYAYALDSEYGLKHPMFTKHAHDVAARLSGEYKPGLFDKHPDVYNDSGVRHIYHPNTPSHAIDQHFSEQLHGVAEWDDQSDDHIEAMVSHPNTSSETITHLINHPRLNHRSMRPDLYVLGEHPNLTPEHINHLIGKGADANMTEHLLEHPRVNESNITAAMNHPSPSVRLAAIQHPAATGQHALMGMQDTSWENGSVRAAAVKHPAIKSHMLYNALSDDSAYVRRNALSNPNIEMWHLDKAIQDPDIIEQTIAHPKIRPHHIQHVIDNQHDYSITAVSSAYRHPNATPEQIQHGLDHQNPYFREAAAENPNAQEHHLKQAMQSSWDGVRVRAAKHKNMTVPMLRDALNDPNDRVAEIAGDRLREMGHKVPSRW